MRLRRYSLVPAIAGALALTSCALVPEDAMHDVLVTAVQERFEQLGDAVNVTREQAECVVQKLDQQGVSLEQLPKIIEDLSKGDTSNVSAIGNKLNDAAASCGISTEHTTAPPTN